MGVGVGVGVVVCEVERVLVDDDTPYLMISLVLLCFKSCLVSRSI